MTAPLWLGCPVAYLPFTAEFAALRQAITKFSGRLGRVEGILEERGR